MDYQLKSSLLALFLICAVSGLPRDESESFISNEKLAPNWIDFSNYCQSASIAWRITVRVCWQLTGRCRSADWVNVVTTWAHSSRWDLIHSLCKSVDSCCCGWQANWYKAAKFCRYHGMQLASIESQEENDKLEKHVKEFGELFQLFGTIETKESKSSSIVLHSSGCTMFWGVKQSEDASRARAKSNENVQFTWVLPPGGRNKSDELTERLTKVGPRINPCLDPTTRPCLSIELDFLENLAASLTRTEERWSYVRPDFIRTDWLKNLKNSQLIEEMISFQTAPNTKQLNN